MDTATLQEKKVQEENLALQRLLDAISSILAEEYISAVKQNPKTFIKQGENK